MTIDYPDTPALADFCILDRSYRQMKQNANPVEVKSTDPNVDKKTLRLQQLQGAYEIIRAKQVQIAV